MKDDFKLGIFIGLMADAAYLLFYLFIIICDRIFSHSSKTPTPSELVYSVVAGLYFWAFLQFIYVIPAIIILWIRDQKPAIWGLLLVAFLTFLAWIPVCVVSVGALFR